MDIAGIIVAAGKGTRLGDSIVGGAGPKALRMLAGKTLVRWSAERLVAGGVNKLIVVCAPENRQQFQQSLTGLEADLTLCDGGQTRQVSVSNGLAQLPQGCQVVLVHDAARPLVPPALVKRVIAAVVSGAEVVVPVVPVADTIRQLTVYGSRVVDRSRLRGVQTPQGFCPKVLVDSHNKAGTKDLTDDAGVCEAAGYNVTMVAGDSAAMKITTPNDFVVAEALLNAGLVGDGQLED